MKEQFKEEMLQVKILGQKIGYGNLMTMASALWRHDLKKNNLPTSGAFVAKIGKPDRDDLNYDRMIDDILNLINTK